MSIAEDKLIRIREQVQNHLNSAAENALSPERRRELEEQIRARLQQNNAVIVAHYYGTGNSSLS